MFYETLKSLCTEKGVRVTNVILELGMGTGNLSSWKSGNVPKGDTLSKLADYFCVSTDYLLGRTEIRETGRSGTEALDLSSEEWDLLRAYRGASPDDRAIIDNIVHRYTHESASQHLA